MKNEMVKNIITEIKIVATPKYLLIRKYEIAAIAIESKVKYCLLYTSPSPRD